VNFLEHEKLIQKELLKTHSLEILTSGIYFIQFDWQSSRFVKD
jgi:hypothetical protein